MTSENPAPTPIEEPIPREARPYGKIVLSLDNVLFPPEKTESSPSRVDGLDEKSERELRFIGCELIQTAGILLKLPQVAMASGQVLFQRFYYLKSFVRLPMEHTAMAALCLASKIEEAPRRIRDIINVFNHIRQVRASRKILPVVLDQNYVNLKNQVIKAERRILKTLGFCVHVKHPHKLIVTYLNRLQNQGNVKLTQLAWNYMNDSLRSDVFVRFTPEAIACSCIFLAARKLDVPLPRRPRPWYELFDVSTDDIMEIAFTILALYKLEKPDWEKLERRIADLEKAMKEAKERSRPAGFASAGNTPIGAGLSGALSPSAPFSRGASPMANKENQLNSRASSVTAVDNRGEVVSGLSKKMGDNKEVTEIIVEKKSASKAEKRRSKSRTRSPSRKRRRRTSSADADRDKDRDRDSRRRRHRRHHRRHRDRSSTANKSGSRQKTVQNGKKSNSTDGSGTSDGSSSEEGSTDGKDGYEGETSKGEENGDSGSEPEVVSKPKKYSSSRDKSKDGAGLSSSRSRKEAASRDRGRDRDRDRSRSHHRSSGRHRSHRSRHSRHSKKTKSKGRSRSRSRSPSYDSRSPSPNKRDSKKSSRKPEKSKSRR